MISSADELETRLRPLMHVWHRCERGDNDGNAGNTLEDLLGIEENNIPLPDYGDIEIKSQAYETGSLLTLFHSEPKPRASVPKLLKALGWRHSEAGTTYRDDEMSFRSTTYAHMYSVRGFTIRKDVATGRINFVFDPARVSTNAPDRTTVYATYGDWLADVMARENPNYTSIFPIYYNIEDVRRKFTEKLDHTLLVMFNKKTENGRRFFKFEEGILTRNLQFDRVLELIDNGTIAIDFDARTRHNHGTKFRITKGTYPKFCV